MPSRLLATLLVATALSGAACGIATPSDNDIDEVAGTIPIGGSDAKNFEAKRNGELQVTMSTLTPTPSASLGLALGQPANGVCTPLASYVAPLVANRTVEFGYINKGSYCILLYDTGVLTVATAYAGKISHP